MTPSQALKHFKTRKAMAEAAAVTRQAVALWFRFGTIPARSKEILRRIVAEQAGRKG